ncbi:MAG: FliH/SctL family protein [Alphaproteobacteria bacterium]
MIRPFTFDLSFDEDDLPTPARAPGRKGSSVPDAPPAPPAPPVFTQEDLKAAHDQGYQDGRAAAQIEAAESTERTSAMAVERIAEALGNLDRERAEDSDATARLAGTIATGIARKLFPHYAETQGLDEIEALVHQSLASLLTPARITIRVAPDAVASLQDRMADAVAQAAFEGQATVVADPAIGPGDAAVDWGDGGATRDSARIWREIDAAVDAMTSRVHPEPLRTTPVAAPSEQPTPTLDETAAAPARRGPQPKVRQVAPPQGREPKS